ncbi:SusC/RagA family TonB-linked outer membrane protein [Gelidibacter japonicus]|uniref:SusC/RagA family TonB-linked outer membrane protein n=1 Tax=Gelidibacter japonicus TaxID=1962232 RepID=UPI003A8F1E89
MTFFLMCSMAMAQVMEVNGSVVSDDGMPIVGASVIVKGTSTGAQTDFDGNFTLKTERNSTLVVSYLGYKTQEVTLTGPSIKITLIEDAAVLDEVVVTAYGTSTKSDFTGSATQIDSEAIGKRPLTNVINALDGASAGVKVSTANGQPGSSPNIRVRGIGSVNASSSPLIVVDGVEYVGSFSSINSNDIESLTVLKDAASTSLYGSRAANGVIMITTKKGRQGTKTYSLEASTGIVTRSVKEYDRVNALQYYPLMWEAKRNALSISGSTPEAQANITASNGIFKDLGINPFNVPNDQIVLNDGTLNPAASLLYPEDLDWQAPLLRTGIRRNINFSYSGADQHTDYYVSLGYLDEEGYIRKSDFERVTARINVNSQLEPWLKTGLNLAGSTATSNNANDSGTSSLVNPFRTTRYIAPIYPVYLHDVDTGEYILDKNGERIYDSGAKRVGSTSGRHVIQENLLNIDKDKNFSFNGRAYAEMKFLNDFTFTFNAALDKRSINNENYDNPIIGDGATAGRAGRSSVVNTTVNYNQLLRYDKSFGDHTLGVLLGHESFQTERTYLRGFRSGLIVDGNTELINFTTTLDSDSNTRKLAREGYFSSLTYDFDKKYYLSGSFRRDGSSRFNKDVRWGDFYSIGAAWRIDQEEFLKNVSWVNTLKLRGSYGEVGNDNLGGFYVSQALFSLGYNNQAEGGILASTTGNQFLTWENNIQSDIALEFGFLNNRISGTVEYYNRKSENLLFDVPLPVSAGLDDYPENIGSMSNKGVEIDLTLGIIRSTDFNWRLNLNASTLKNEITELPQEEIINGSKKLVVGGDIYAYWLRSWYGVDASDGSGLYVVDPALQEVGETDVRTMDDGTVVTTNHNKALYDFAGTATPDLFGAINSEFIYKNFDFGFTFTYQLGGKTYDTNYANLMSAGTYGNAMHVDILDRWQKPGDVTEVPRLDAKQTTAFDAGSSRWLVKSDYIALRQVNLGYNFSQLADAIGLSKARLYLNGENLFQVNSRKGLETGENFNGTNSNRFTPSRIVTLGVNVTF